MAPRTPRHPQRAGPFVTLSIPKSSVSRLSLNGANDTVSATAKSVLATAKNTKVIANRSSKSDRDLAPSITTPAATPSKRRKKPAQVASPQSSLIADDTSTLVNFKSDENNDSHDGNQIPVPATRQSPRSRTKFSKNEDTDLPDAKTDRRSSTASLTDSVTRLSHRNRKLTSKAQALAGTNFLPSLNNVSDIESLSSPTLIEPTHESIAREVHDKASETLRPETPDTGFDEPFVESVETPTIRTSARQRKPTARAIEHEIVKVSHKRPASPAMSERSFKIAKHSPSTLTKPSMLRHSAVNAEKISDDDADQQSLEQSVPAEDEESKPLGQEERPTRKMLKSSPARKTSSRAVQEKAANGLSHDEVWSGKHKKSKTTDHHDEESSTVSSSPLWSPKPDSRTTEQIEADNEKDLLLLEAQFPPPSSEHAKNLPNEQVTAAQETRLGESVPKCDLSCLTPSSCLLAFARLAADLSDSDSDISIDDEELLRDDIDLVNGQSNVTALQDTLGILGALRPTHCQCPNKTTQTSVNSPLDLQAEQGGNVVPLNSQPRMDQGNGDSLKPREDKSCELRQQPAMSESHQQKTSEKRPQTIRQGSSFEQRMQADYISSQKEKAKAKPQSSGYLVKGRTNSSTVERLPPAATFSPKPIRFEVNGNHTDTIGLRAEDRASGNTVTVFKTNREPLGNSSSAKTRASRLEHRRGSAEVSTLQHNHAQDNLPTSVRPIPAMEHAKGKADAIADKKTTKASGKSSVAKSSAAGSVRASLQNNKTGQKKDTAMKQPQSGITPPPLQTSIKLRFNMSSR